MHTPKVYIQSLHKEYTSDTLECIHSLCKLDYVNLDIHIFINCLENQKEEIYKLDHTSKKKVLGYLETERAFEMHEHADWLMIHSAHCLYKNFRWVTECINIINQNPEDKILHIQADFLSKVNIQKIKTLKSYSDGYFLIRGYEYVLKCIQHKIFTEIGSLFNVKIKKQVDASGSIDSTNTFLSAARAALLGYVLVGSKEVGYCNCGPSDINLSDEPKNEVEYYKFFEWAEDFLSFKELKKIVLSYEKSKQSSDWTFKNFLKNLFGLT